MSKKIISTPEGYRIKEFDAKGNSVGVSEEVFATEIEANDAIRGVKVAKKEVKAEPEEATVLPDLAEVDLESMKLAELKQLADDLGYDTKGRRTKKARLIEAMREQYENN